MTPERHAQLQEIFEAAVNLTEPQRTAYLDEVCAGDLELRGRLIQLLNADDETVGMAGPTAAPAGLAVMECPKCWRCYQTPQSACPRDGSILQVAFAGQQLIDDKYLVERRLGRGGMGAVYLAQHVGLEKRFALKVILEEGALSPAYRESFENEARALGRLNHPHIVNVTDYGVNSRRGLPYLVMEYLVGKPLSEMLKEQKVLPFEEAIRLLRDTADAVDAAHANNIVHGDLKPANLFLCEASDSEPAHLKVVDFGLARLRNPASGARPEDGTQGPRLVTFAEHLRIWLPSCSEVKRRPPRATGSRLARSCMSSSPALRRSAGSFPRSPRTARSRPRRLPRAIRRFPSKSICRCSHC